MSEEKEKPCENCHGKGFIEYARQWGGQFIPSIEQCPKCRDVTKYSAEVQRRRGLGEAKIIPLRREKCDL